MKKKNLVLLSILLTLAMFVTACSGQGAAPASSAPKSSAPASSAPASAAPATPAPAPAASEIKIGAVLPMTGDVATFGKSTKQGVELAMAQYNAAGGINGKQIKLIVQDDENKPESSVAALQKLINNDKVVAVVGSVASKCTLAMAPVATQNKIPIISGSSTNPKVTSQKGNDFAFRACFIDPFQGTVIAKFATDTLKAKTAAVMYDVGNDYTVGLYEFFKAGFEKSGGKVVAAESYNNGDQDFNAQLTKIKQLNPDVIVLTDYYQAVGLIAKQARALGIKATFLGGDGWDSPDLVKIGGAAIDGGYFSNHYSPDDSSPDIVQFLKDYKAKYNDSPDALAALGYDAAKMLFEAIKKANSTDGTAIQQALLKTDLKSVTGSIKLNAQRDPEKSAVMIKIEKGKQVFAGKVNP